MTEVNLLKPSVKDDLIVDVNKSIFNALIHEYLGISGSMVALIVLAVFAVWQLKMPEEILGYALIFPIIGISLLSTKIQSKFMKQFADKNNFKYYQSGAWAAEIGSLFKRGHGQDLYNLIVGKYQDYKFRLFNYDFSEGSGKNKQHYTYTVVDLEFNMNLPRLYLDARVGQWFKDSLARGLVELPLSAVEFEKKFKLYITPGSQIAALQVFTPDLMSELLDFDSHFNIELVGHQIYIYQSGEVSKAKKLADMYKVAAHVIENVGKEAEKIRPM